ncbi:hypothetical protein HY480_01540 [Candidatus Uhrbacteria bacterium]|nr:hypothetical protein [Candidatus Uhrbacteria bacterium]
MKVVKKGRPQKGWAKEFTCTGDGNRGGGCGARLLVEKDDLFRTESHALHETDYYVTFECLACGVLTDINERGIHAHELPDRSAWRRKARGVTSE